MELTEIEKQHLINLVEAVLVVVANDDTGVAWDLGELATTAGEILGLTSEYMEELR